ncbi:hypothetical protein GBA65_15245 [Rubrobacter marinus]|uniref:Uncharacterized protein n=1 Tax=Rubrobacter marinus TaxID=2653852 RepID=A0A6G8PZK3_9ACTN|nr:hypothetical protein [Rubrobacter marinus]QIN79659.1 hypothetical protein GBA65_15245 [Rubrobacter marinus]
MIGITRRGGLEERADEVRCVLVVDGECGGRVAGRPGALEYEEELLDELAEIEVELLRGRDGGRGSNGE